jgi:methyl-accepting chemotaxis protein
MKTLLLRLSLTMKLALAPAFALLCLLVVAAVTLQGLTRMREVSSTLDASNFPAYELATRIEREVDALNGLVNQSLAWTGAEMKATDIAKLDASLARQFADTRALIVRSTQDAALDPAVVAEVKELLPAFVSYEAAVGQTMDLKPTGLTLAAMMLTGSEESFAKLKVLTGRMIAHQRESMAGAVAQSNDVASRTIALFSTVCALALISVIAATVVISRAVSAPILRAESVARSVAQGDLSAAVHVEGVDATARMLEALSHVTTNLSGMVGEIRESAETIQTASTEIANGNLDLSQRTEMQSTSLQQTAASMEDLSVRCTQSSENAREARSLAEGATKVAQNGQEMVRQVVESMRSIESQARRISEIIGVIDGIAFQTNILALNAAVEAARAGEQGRGFAVVASEVRALAARSAGAAKEIRTLIGTSVAQVEMGTQRVELAGRTMREVVDAISGVEQRVDEIHRATSYQADGITQVNESISGLDRATQQNAALVEESAAAAESLRDQARQLVTSMSRFRLRDSVAQLEVSGQLAD